MRTQKPKTKVGGMTLFEVLVVIAVLLLVVAILLPQILRPRKQRARGERISCMNSLKQVGLAFRIWQGDNNDKFPMQVSVTNGGTMELVESGTVWQHFQVMSNELNTPKFLLCPADADSNRRRATCWTCALNERYEQIPFLGNTHTSYFVGVDAVDTNPTMFLAGDRNLMVNNVAFKPGLHSLGTNELVGWTRELHVNQGNVLMADASVQQLSQPGLVEALKNTGTVTNRLAIP